ncbi:MAG: GNAT family N-acetyltransferase [Clostridia bacterium]|nr:GNAT family N-acetyltransferase [Clostridia bacterium]
MTHNMKLWRDAFYSIADGSKTIELRLNDEKRQQITVEDTIIFSCTKNNDMITAKVKALHKFADFKALYEHLPLDKCGYTKDELKTAHYTDMEQYYSKEQITKYGALGIELCDICAICDVKENIADSGIFELLAPSVYNPTPERLSGRAKKYQANDKAYIYAYSQNGENLGIVVFEIAEQSATILDIAVKPEQQGKGIGSGLIDFIFNQFDINTITAETDDDAVRFYKKYGFTIADTITKFDDKRYICICKK